MGAFENAIREAQREARERFSEGEFTIETLLWCDCDFRVEAKHGFSQTDEGNSLQKRIVITPHSKRLELIEIAESEKFNIHESEEL